MGVGNCYKCGFSEYIIKYCIGKLISDVGKYIIE